MLICALMSSGVIFEDFFFRCNWGNISIEGKKNQETLEIQPKINIEST